MTCSRCGAADADAIRDTRALCRECAELDDWATIIDIAQETKERSTLDLSNDVATPTPTAVAADPFA